MTRSKLKALPQALMAALIVTPIAFAQAQTATPPSQKVEKIEVTGSNIKRVDSESVAPIQIITREDIQASGRNTIAEVLRDLAVNSGNGFNEGSGVNSFAPGATGISLRGLGPKNTLILVNSRRMAAYGFAQNLSDTFVDVNQIPASAVDRIEVLKAGASHIYGSDAIAGVVNIILRKDFTGVEISGGAGTSSEGGGTEYRASIAAGKGDLGRDKYNVLVTADYFKRDLLMQTERNYTKNNDWRDQIAGDFSRPGIAVYIPFGAAAAAPNPNRIAMPGCTGQVLTVQQINPSTTLRGNNCVQNFAEWNTLAPSAERMGILARGTLDVSPTLQLFAEAGYSDSKNFQKFQPPFIGTANTFLDPATGRPGTILGLIPATSPYAYVLNGVRTAAQFQYVFTEAGGRNADVDNETSRFLIGAKGTMGAWDWEAGATIARNEVSRIGYNVILSAPLISLLANNSYNYFNRADPANRAVLNGLLTTTVRKSNSKLDSFDLKASREIMQTANGPVGLALGVETRSESMTDIPDPRSRNGGTTGSGSVQVEGKRRNSAFFAEVNGKPFRTVEVQAAFRSENYSDFGTKTVPGIGAKWALVPEVLLRANYSKGFRAPTLPENSKSSAIFFIGITDPILRENYNTSGSQVGSGSLKPETSDNYNWGVLWEPTKDTSIGIDFYRIKQEDVVDVDDFDFILNNPALYPGQIVRSATDNRVLSISAKYINLASTETKGFDIEARHRFSIGEWGRITLLANYSYIDSFKQVLAPGQPPIEGVDSNTLGTLPRFRGTLSAAWERGNWTARLNNRHIAGYDQAGATALPQQTRVGASDFQDFFLAYRGFKNLTLTGAITNLRDLDPPYDGNAGNRYAASQYDLKGRFYTFGASYSFK